jgi:hypothetical protein
MEMDELFCAGCGRELSEDEGFVVIEGETVCFECYDEQADCEGCRGL